MILALALAATLASPPPHYSQAVAFDEARGRLVVFGGYMKGRYSGATWEWDGTEAPAAGSTSWTEAATTGPEPRNGGALADDSRRKRCVLFGGDTRERGEFGDTWEWDGAAWTRVTAATSPSARTNTRLAYDAARGRIVLFGGVSGGKTLGDTWEFDGATWTLAATEGPGPRFLCGFAHDAARGRTVLFGGMPEARPGATPLGDTWEWDGARWTEAKATGPVARDHTALGYDPVAKRVVLAGGASADGPFGDTWLFDGKAWTRAPGDAPPRAGHHLAFDTKRGALLLFGGFVGPGPTSEIWARKGDAWSRL